MLQSRAKVFQKINISFKIISFLGRSGVFCTKEGLKIAYVSGIDKPDDVVASKKSEFHLDYDRIKSIEVRSKCHETNFSGVDILISSDWPKGNFTFLGGSTLVSFATCCYKPDLRPVS